MANLKGGFAIGSMRRQGNSLQTEKTYLYWITRFENHDRTPQPDNCSTEHVKDFLTWLAAEKGVARATAIYIPNAL